MKRRHLIIGAIFIFLLLFAFFLSRNLDNSDFYSDDEIIQLLDQDYPWERRDEGQLFLEYEVKESDTLESIAEYFEIEKQTILSVNNLTEEQIVVGKILLIPPVDGIAIITKAEDTLSDISEEYSVAEQIIADFNWLDYPYSLEEGMELFIPFMVE